MIYMILMAGLAWSASTATTPDGRTVILMDDGTWTTYSDAKAKKVGLYPADSTKVEEGAEDEWVEPLPMEKPAAPYIPPAQSAPVTKTSSFGDAEAKIDTQEGDELIIEKKGRWYTVQLSADEPGNGIKRCSVFLMMKTPFALSMKSAGQRAQGTGQVGSILSYQDNLMKMLNGNSLTPGVCAMGLDSFPGSVVVTLGTTFKMTGRTATIAPADAIKIGDWLMDE